MGNETCKFCWLRISSLASQMIAWRTLHMNALNNPSKDRSDGEARFEVIMRSSSAVQGYLVCQILLVSGKLAALWQRIGAEACAGKADVQNVVVDPTLFCDFWSLQGALKNLRNWTWFWTVHLDMHALHAHIYSLNIWWNGCTACIIHVFHSALAIPSLHDCPKRPRYISKAPADHLYLRNTTQTPYIW